jgi:hypothetical protein
MGKVKVSNGRETFEIDSTDLGAALKDGFKPTERVIVANSKTKEIFEVDPADVGAALKEGFSYQDIAKKQTQPAFQVQVSEPTFMGGKQDASWVQPSAPNEPIKIKKEEVKYIPPVQDEATIRVAKFRGEAIEAHKQIHNELVANDAQYEKAIREARRDNYTVEKLRDDYKAMGQILSPQDEQKILQIEKKRQYDMPVTPAEIDGIKTGTILDDKSARKFIKDLNKGDVAAKSWMVDKYNEVANDPNASERIPKIKDVEKEIKAGRVLYDPETRQAIKPVGIVGSIVEGTKNKFKLEERHDFFKNTENDAAIISELEYERNNPTDDPVIVPKNRISKFAMSAAEMPVGPMVAGFAGTFGGSFIGAPQLGMAGATALGAYENRKIQYTITFEQVYNELRDQGRTEAEALAGARRQAENAQEIGTLVGAAQGAVGAKIGAIKIKGSSFGLGYQRAVGDFLKKNGSELGKVALDAVAQGGVAAGGELVKNKLAQAAGIKRELTANMADEFWGNIYMAGGIGVAIMGARAIGKLNYKRVMHGLVKNVPDEAISSALQDRVASGEITQQAADQAQQRVNEYKAKDAQIPANVSEEARFKIQDNIDKLDELEAQKEATHPSLRGPIEEKITKLTEENLALSKEVEKAEKPLKEDFGLSKEQQEEATGFAEELLIEGLIPGTYETEARDNPLKFWRDIAQQAQNRDANWKPFKAEDAQLSEQAARDQFGDTIVDYAMEIFPAPEVKESGIPVIMPGEIRQPETITIKPKEDAIQIGEPETLLVGEAPRSGEEMGAGVPEPGQAPGQEGEQRTQEEGAPPAQEGVGGVPPPPTGRVIDMAEYGEGGKDLDKLANNIPDSGKVAEYMSKGTIEKYTGETPTNVQARGVQELQIALTHGEKIIEKAKDVFGDDYTEKTLDYIDNSTAGVSNKALMYVSLENALGREKLANPERAAEITKLQALVYEKSQAFARENSLALNYQRLRRIAKVGYDLDKVTENFFSPVEAEGRKSISKAVEADADAINKAAEEIEAGAIDPAIDKAVKEGVAKEIEAIYSKLPKEKKTLADKAIAALDKIHDKLRGRTYESTLGIPVAIIDGAVLTIRNAIKAGVKIADAVEMGIAKVKEKYKDWANEDAFRKDVIDGLREQGAMDDAQNKQAAKEYRMLETERNRQLGIVSRLTNQLRDLEAGKRSVPAEREVKPDTPEIEALKTKIKDETKKLNAIDAQKKRIDNLEAELERLQKRLPKEQKAKSVREVSSEEQGVLDKIKAEKESIAAENTKTRLERAKEATQERIEKVKNEILAKERELKEAKKPLHEDLELQRLREVEKTITELRDKYLPEEADPIKAAKQRERVKDKLVANIIDLNDQINAREKKAIPEKPNYENDSEIAKLRQIKEEKKAILDEIDPPAPPIEKTRAERVATAEGNLQRRIDEIRDEIIKGERDVKATKDKLQSKKLDQLRAQKKSLETLRDKYLPKDKDPYSNEKAEKAVEKRLIDENIELNRQIAKGEKDKVEGKVTPESENIDKLKAERDARKEILEALDPVPKDYVKQALIEQGFGREKVIKGERKQILDWKKLAGAAGTTTKISENVAKALERDGFTEAQLDRIKDAFIQEYIDLRTSVIEKAQNELARRNKETVTQEQKSAARKLAELYTYGLFESQQDTFENTLNKALGASVSEQGFNEAREIAKAMETLYSSSFQGVKLSDVSAKTALHQIEDRMRQLLFSEAKKQGNFNLRAAQIVRNYFEVQQTMILNNMKQLVENPLSGFQQNIIESINGMISKDGIGTPEMGAQRRALMRTMYKDMVLNGSIGYGKTESAFVNRAHLDDYINKLSDNKLYHGIMSVLSGKATLNAADAMFKASITEKKFATNLIKLLTHETNPNRMSKSDAVAFVSEKLTGQTFEDAKVSAKEIINKINKDAGRELIPENEETIIRFANDIVKASLEMGGRLTTEHITAAYNAAYKSAGLGLGHEANNILSSTVMDYSAKLESRINDAIKDKEWNRAALLTAQAILFRNVLNPFVGGGTNWMVLKFEKMGLGLFTGLGYRLGSNTKLDMTSEAGMKVLEKRLYNQARIKDSYMRGLVGGAASALTYLAFTGLANTDEYRKWRGKNMWAARYLDIIKPEMLLAQMAIKNKEVKKYVASTLNKNDAFDATTKIIKASDYAMKGESEKAKGAIGEALGAKFNVPLPWRLIKDGQVIYQGVTGQDPYHGNYKPSTGFMNGVFQGGAIEWLGLRPDAQAAPSKTKATLHKKSSRTKRRNPHQKR